MVITTSSCGLANWSNCLDSPCFCLFRLGIFYVRSYIFMFLWRVRMHILSLFFNIIFMGKLLSFWMKWRQYFPFDRINLIICTCIIIIIKYQIIWVLSWFNVIFQFLEIELTFYLDHILIIKIVIIISVLKIFNNVILIYIFLACIDIWS
jgi:hypothetical protein